MVPQVAGDGQFWQVTQVAGLLGMGMGTVLLRVYLCLPQTCWSLNLPELSSGILSGNKFCYGSNCGPLKFVCLSLNLWYLRMWIRLLQILVNLTWLVSLRKEEFGTEKQTHTQKMSCDDEGRDRGGASTSQGALTVASKSSEAGTEVWNRRFPHCLRKKQPCRHLALRLLASRTVKTMNTVVLSHLVCGALL